MKKIAITAMGLTPREREIGFRTGMHHAANIPGTNNSSQPIAYRKLRSDRRARKYIITMNKAESRVKPAICITLELMTAI